MLFWYRIIIIILLKLWQLKWMMTIINFACFLFIFQAYERRSNGGYTSARKLANAAVILNVVCVFWVMFCGIITVSFVSACVYEAGICGGYYYYYDK